MKTFVLQRKVAAILVGIVAGILIPSIVSAWPWSTDMMNQPSIKPQEGVMLPFPKRSIPVMGIPTKVKNREESKALVNPVPPSKASFRKGRQLYRIYCATCHGMTGRADSPVGLKMGAINLIEDYVQQNLTEGWIWGTISFGSYVMPAYGVPGEQGGSNDLTVTERWHVVNYLKNELIKEGQ